MCQRLKDEVRGNVLYIKIHNRLVISKVQRFVPNWITDLHSELSRQNRKQNKTLNAGSGDSRATDETPVSHSKSSSQHHQSSPAQVQLGSSSLIKSNPSPQGTPLHTTFSGTQHFTPSTRISALNMVGDLLRKVGVCC